MEILIVYEIGGELTLLPQFVELHQGLKTCSIKVDVVKRIQHFHHCRVLDLACQPA
jgi:hypothetical protein